MKQTKLTLPIIAFILALTTALADDVYLDLAKGIRPSDGSCTTGILIPPPSGKLCLSTNCLNRCSVIIQEMSEDQEVPAYDITKTCPVFEALYYDNIVW